NRAGIVGGEAGAELVAIAVEELTQVGGSECHVGGRVVSAFRLLWQRQHVPATRDGGGGRGLHLHEPAGTGARDSIMAKEALLPHDGEDPVGGKLGELAGGRYGGGVGPRVPEPQIIELASLSERGDRLRI